MPFGIGQRKEVVLWEFHTKRTQFLHLHRDTEVVVKSKEKNSTDPWWAVPVKHRCGNGLVNEAFMAPRKDIDQKEIVYKKQWFVGDLNPVEAMMKMAEPKGRKGEFLVLAPKEYRLIGNTELSWPELLLLVRIQDDTATTEKSRFQTAARSTMSEEKGVGDTGPVLPLRIKRDQYAKYTVVKGRSARNLYELVDDLIENGIPIQRSRTKETVRLTEPPSWLVGQEIRPFPVPPPPADPTEDLKKYYSREENDERRDEDKRVRRIPRNQIKKGHKPVGEGQFGTVYKARLQEKQAGRSVIVALKIMKQDTCQIQDLKDEIQVMQKLQNKYLVQLYGLCNADSKTMIVTEFIEEGSLDSCLREREEKGERIPLRGLVEILYQIACGMGYMEHERVVHRDLAARNVLVKAMTKQTATVKISDFGLSRILKDDDYYKTTKKYLPWKWMALESIGFKKFTAKTDVWSFGIVIHEVMTHGGKPYGTLTNKQVLKMLEKGERLPRDDAVPEFLYEKVCKKCWRKDPEKRPTFVDIMKYLGDLIFDGLEGTRPRK